MGRAARWLRSLLGRKKEKLDLENSNSGKQKDRKRWSFGKVGKDPGRAPATDLSWAGSYETEEQSKHAIAVAAATAAAADAAVAAAHAAVAVVRLTSQGRSGLFGRGKESCAAVRIQTVFRGYLARKALRALKGLVKLQALFRGYLVRKRATATLYSMQALMRAQVAVRSDRARRSLTRENRYRLETCAGRSTVRSEFHSQRQLPQSLENGFDDSPKTVEMDTFKPRSRSEWSNEPPPPPCYTFSSPLPSAIPVRLHRTRGSRPLHDPADWAFSVDECRASTTHSSPRFGNSGTPSAAPATPAKSLCGDSFFRPYCNFPGYMANTKSSKAKLRSQSAPKPRPEGAGRKAVSLEEILASRNSISGVRMQRCYSKDGSYF